MKLIDGGKKNCKAGQMKTYFAYINNSTAHSFTEDC